MEPLASGSWKNSNYFIMIHDSMSLPLWGWNQQGCTAVACVLDIGAGVGHRGLHAGLSSVAGAQLGSL